MLHPRTPRKCGFRLENPFIVVLENPSPNPYSTGLNITHNPSGEFVHSASQLTHPEARPCEVAHADARHTSSRWSRHLYSMHPSAVEECRRGVAKQHALSLRAYTAQRIRTVDGVDAAVSHHADAASPPPPPTVCPCCITHTPCSVPTTTRGSCACARL